jgi:hypothetical protein
VPVLGFVIVNESVDTSFTTMGSGAKFLLIEGGPMTVTVSRLVLFGSLSSRTFPFGSTVAVFAKVPAAVGVTANVTLNEAPTGIVTMVFATQFRAVPAIEQLIVPTGAIPPFVTVSAPCG